MFGTGSPSYIVQSTFQNNTASNAGAVGMLWAGAFIFNSLFEGNSAVGTGANNNDASECTCMNNGQNQVGSGGNGGATADGSAAELVIDDSVLLSNTSPISYWNWCPGVSTGNPHASGSMTCSPSPVDTKFCTTTSTCSTTCSS
jgi:hypothetical protein